MDDFLNQTFNQQTIENLIRSNTEESLQLEFKRGDALKNDDRSKKEIAKDISAFANSAGGIIIYGIAEQGHKATELSFVTDEAITKEWVEQVINTRIQRKIPGLRIDTIRYDNKISQTVYVVKVPESPDAPHMASDKCFYRRHNFQVLHMEEYEIRNLYARIAKTHLEIKKPKIIPQTALSNQLVEYRVDLRFEVMNIGTAIEKLYKLVVSIPRRIAINSHGYGKDNICHQPSRMEGQHTLYSISGASPLFQGEIASLGIATIKIIEPFFSDILEHDIILKLYYSNGTQELHFNLIKELKSLDINLTRDNFKIG